MFNPQALGLYCGSATRLARQLRAPSRIPRCVGGASGLRKSELLGRWTLDDHPVFPTKDMDSMGSMDSMDINTDTKTDTNYWKVATEKHIAFANFDPWV